VLRQIVQEALIAAGCVTATVGAFSDRVGELVNEFVAEFVAWPVDPDQVDHFRAILVQEAAHYSQVYSDAG
jgi:hypothetical protein